MEDKKLHPVVELLIARAGSHPEEFGDTEMHRWCGILDDINAYGSDDDKAAMDAVMRTIMLDRAHSDAMDELLNGEERRAAKQRAEAAAAIQTVQTQSQMLGQQAADYANMAKYYRSVSGLGNIAAPPTSGLLGTIKNTFGSRR